MKGGKGGNISWTNEQHSADKNADPGQQQRPRFLLTEAENTFLTLHIHTPLSRKKTEIF